MSAVRPEIDLSALARREPPPDPPRRPLAARLVPLTLFAAFSAVVVWGARDLLRPRVEVTVVRPRPAEPGSAAAVTGVAFQAAGWVEPDPFPLEVVPLTAGTVAEVLVQESDAVARGAVVARLVDEDARLELERARGELARARGERAAAEVELDFAQRDFEAAIAVTERHEVAQAELEGERARRELLHEAARRAAAEVRVAEEELEVQRALEGEGAAGPRQVELAAARVESARASEARAQAEAANAGALVGRAEARLRAAEQERELRIEERRRVAAAGRALERARGMEGASEAAVALAELRLARTEVRAPWDGVVLERLTVPGARAGASGGGAVCSLYDPASLRVRVDVPQGEVEALFVGQRAEITCDARPGRPYSGEVTRVVQRADIQKVTLQAHVRVEEPDELLRPEMLCQVRFAARDEPATPGQPTGDLVLVPARLLVDGARVWVLDPRAQRASLRAVMAGRARGEWVEVRSGLNLSDKLLDRGRERVEEGTRVSVVEER